MNNIKTITLDGRIIDLNTLSIDELNEILELLKDNEIIVKRELDNIIEKLA